MRHNRYVPAFVTIIDGGIFVPGARCVKSFGCEHKRWLCLLYIEARTYEAVDPSTAVLKLVGHARPTPRIEEITLARTSVVLQQSTSQCIWAKLGKVEQS